MKHSSQWQACLLVPKTAARLIRLGHAIFLRPHGARGCSTVGQFRARNTATGTSISGRSAAARSRNLDFADLRPTTIALTFALSPSCPIYIATIYAGNGKAYSAVQLPSTRPDGTPRPPSSGSPSPGDLALVSLLPVLALLGMVALIARTQTQIVQFKLIVSRRKTVSS